MELLGSPISTAVLLLLVILSITWIIRLELRIRSLTRGTNKKNLETGLYETQAFAKEFSAFKERALSQLENVEKRLKKGVSKVETVRFDPFKGTGQGGSQSFATALLDEEGSGVVISTIHTRERVGVFSKPIKNGTSEYELTPEEASVVEKAKGQS